MDAETCLNFNNPRRIHWGEYGAVLDLPGVVVIISCLTMSYVPGFTRNSCDLAQRAQAVCLRQYTNMKLDDIAAIARASPRQIQRWNRTAVTRGFDKDGPLLAEHLEDKKREVPLKFKDPEAIEKNTMSVNEEPQEAKTLSKLLVNQRPKGSSRVTGTATWGG